MRTIVAVIVYDRFENIKLWINAWKQSETKNAELIIIHTGDNEENFKSFCIENDVKYIHRQNIGMDIGSFQDVCKERLPEFPNDWDYLLWCTDDTIPMRKDFISPFIAKAREPGVGIAAMQISSSVDPHVRTTGFCISKEISNKIYFQCDPITTKVQCYFFEHRGGIHTLTNQIRKMGLACVQVAPNIQSPLWDMGYWKRLERMNEHQGIFYENEPSQKITFICTIYNTFPQIISCLLLQTYKNWELILIHDGPNETGLREMVQVDKRIQYIETKERLQNYGHPLRKWALDEIREGRLSNPDFIVITNDDNYYVPVFCKSMISYFNSESIKATYCEDMIHSYIGWGIINTKLERGYLDCGGVMVRKDIACEIGWPDNSHSSDWTYFENIMKKYSNNSFSKVPGCLFVHN